MQKRNSDPMLAAIERALKPGKFIRYSEVFDFVEDLEKIEALLGGMAPEPTGHAVRLFEIFLSGCYEKIDECDDSGAYLSMFFQSLFCGWIKARQAMKLPADDTLRQILKWMDHDDYGFCYRIEKDLVKALDLNGRRLLIEHFQGLIAQSWPGTMAGQAKAIFEYSNEIRLPALSLKEVYLSTKAVDSYVELCNQLGFSPLDCEHLAEMEMSLKHWTQALAWVEKGMALEPTRNWHNQSSHDLGHFKPKILAKVGRKDDALAAVWAGFQKEPSEMTYEELMASVPKDQKAAWREKAMNVAMQGELGELMSLCLKTKDWDRLAARIHASTHAQLEAISQYVSEPAAGGLGKRDKLAAGKLYRALAMRILNSKKSKYYDAALGHLRRARKLFLEAKSEPEWQEIMKTIQTEHGRKKGILAGLGLISSGKVPNEPSFAERAQARWREQTS